VPRCQNCPKEAIVGIGPRGDVPLCLDCYGKWSNIQQQAIENHEREINRLAEEVDLVTGMPGFTPRYPPRPPRTVLQGDVVLNNIRISNSNVGVVNTGSIRSIDSAIGVLKAEGSPKLADLLRTLTESIAAAPDMSDDHRTSALQDVSVLAAEAATPQQRRRARAMKGVLLDLSAILGGVASMTQIWQVASPLLHKLFGL
jgi:hypothetical protein